MISEEATGEAAPSDSGPAQPKREYKSPVLVTYGSVRHLTGTSSGDVGDGGAKNMPMSDPTLKENVVRVGEHPAGFGLYLFDYKPEFREIYGQGRQFGVMADEVERVIPEAVSIHGDGYRVVNYALLGICRAHH
jgi:hypothetical protein